MKTAILMQRHGFSNTMHEHEMTGCLPSWWRASLGTMHGIIFDAMPIMIINEELRSDNR
jgi:hypothetical protein